MTIIKIIFLLAKLTTQKFIPEKYRAQFTIVSLPWAQFTSAHIFTRINIFKYNYIFDIRELSTVVYLWTLNRFLIGTKVIGFTIF